MTANKESYISPFSTRYASEEMQYIFSEKFKFTTWHRLWIALAKAEQKMGLDITDEQIEELEKYVPGFDVFVGVGNNGVRRALFERAAAAGADFATLIHPSATVSPGAAVGRGTVIVAGAVVNCGAVIGDGVIVNTCASVDHDCKIGDFTPIAVGAHIAGQADVGEGCFFGAGSAVIQCVTVCAECVIGAGAAVVGDITERGTYVGVPARRIK